MIVTELPEPDKVLIAGDWHGSGSWGQKVIHHARKSGAQAIVHVGDFGWWVDGLDTRKYLRHLQRNLEECGLVLYWIDGNHEDHEYIAGWVDATEGRPWSHAQYANIVHLPRGFRWVWHGKTWLALGGAVSVDKGQRVEGKSWWPGETIKRSDMDNAIDGGLADVMICHDSPHGVDIPGIHAVEKLDVSKSLWPADVLRESDEHRMLVREVVDAVKPTMLFHGHYHVRYTSMLRRQDGLTQVVGLDMNATTLDRNTILVDLVVP